MQRVALDLANPLVTITYDPAGRKFDCEDDQAVAGIALADYASNLSGEILVLTRGNKPVAAIVPLEDADPESVALSGHPEFLEIVARSREDIRQGRTLSLGDMRDAFGAQPLKRRARPQKARRQALGKRESRKRARS